MWAKCATHGPIQDARPVSYGGEVSLFCRCGLACEPFEPDGFIEHEELVELAQTKTQPKKAKKAEPEVEVEDAPAEEA